jgi:uncharacterized protein (TIGR00730 family)
MRRVCVFCGSSVGASHSYAKAAEQMGRVLALGKIGLVYGGGRVGLMGLVADSVLASGGEVIGVIPRALAEREIEHRGLTELRVVSSMHERKALMGELSDAFVALPGGFGTFEEFCEVITWAQLGLHRKPCGILNVEGYYDAFLSMFDRGVTDGFISPQFRNLVLEETDPGRLLERLESYQPPAVTRWIDSSET